MMSDLHAWLEGIGLEQYAETFDEHRIDFDVLGDLTDDNLKDLDIPIGDRIRLLKAIAAVARSESSTVAAGPAAPTAPAAERRQITVMFCDLVGSTELSGKLDPEELRELMAAYQQTAGAAIERYGGHVAQYLGDGVMAYFGWPRAHEDDALHAVRAGLDITEDIQKMEAPADLSVRIGVATGSVVVGETGGGDPSVAKAAVGETPNLAARLQALAEPGTVVIGAGTRGLIGGAFELERLPPRRLKGIATPVEVFRVVGEAETESRFEARATGGLTPFVGRDKEIALLQERWRQAKLGHGQVVLLSGEPGIGKSRLTQALREHIAPEPHVRLRYQCSPHHISTSLYPSIRQFERAAGFARADTNEQKLDKMEALLDRAGGEMSEIVPLFAALLSIETDRYPSLNVSPQRQKQLTLRALADQVVALSTQQPTLLIVEDVHWIDPTSQELLELLVPRVAEQRVLMLLTFRPEYHPPWSALDHVTPVALARLSRGLAASMIDHVTHGRSLPAAVREQIVAKTDGVPLFVEELTKTVLESGLLEDQGPGFGLTGTLTDFSIPSTLHDSLMARLDRLSAVKEVAQVAACIGREFTFEILGAVSSVSQPQLRQALNMLVENELVVSGGDPPAATFTFRHALVQDAAYQSLLKGRRKLVHARIASHLESHLEYTSPPRPEILAYHHQRGGNFQKAAEFWLGAALAARSKWASQEALATACNGLACVEELVESRNTDRLRAALEEVRGMALMRLRGLSNDDAERALLVSRALCERYGFQDILGRLYLSLHIHYASYGRSEEVRESAQSLMTLTKGSPDRQLVAAANVASGYAAWDSGRVREATEHLSVALSMIDPERDSRGYLADLPLDVWTTAWAFQAHSSWVLGKPDTALRLVENALDRAEQIRDPFSKAYALQFLGWVSAFRGDWETALSCAQQQLAIGTEAMIPTFVTWGWLYSGRSLVKLGRVPEAEHAVAQYLENEGAQPEENRTVFHLLALADAHLELGNLNPAWDALTEGLQRMKRHGGRSVEPEYYRLRGCALHRDLLTTELDPKTSAADELATAMALATDRDQLSWRLRIAMDLVTTGLAGKSAAKDLAALYDRFKEGFETADLRAARALIAKPAAPTGMH